MADLIATERSNIVAIADAVRSKTGNSGDMTISQIVDGINGIETGSGSSDELIQLVEGTIEEFNNSEITVVWNGFRSQSYLVSVSLPSLITVGDRAFNECYSLRDVYVPSVTNICDEAFSSCEELKVLDIPNVSQIFNRSFVNSGLRTLILRKQTVCNLYNSDAFDSTPIGQGMGYIYVPSSLLNDYKNADCWSEYEAQFRALEDYTIDGTITGELDLSKTGDGEEEIELITTGLNPETGEMEEGRTFSIPCPMTWGEFIDSDYNFMFTHYWKDDKCFVRIGTHLVIDFFGTGNPVTLNDNVWDGENNIVVVIPIDYFESTL